MSLSRSLDFQAGFEGQTNLPLSLHKKSEKRAAFSFRVSNNDLWWGFCEAPGLQAPEFPCRELMRTSKEPLTAAVVVTTQLD